jgi:RNA binding exosome subunit
LAHKIGVLFPERDTWSTLSGNYFDLKEMLTEKYGEPSDVMEKFEGSDYAQPRDDNDRMYKVKFDKCKYYSIWRIDKGEIELSIEHEDVMRCYIRLAYFDKINTNIIKAKAKKDL